MNIFPNLTLVLLQLVPFLLTIISLWFIIFKPMLEYLEARDDASSGAATKAKQLEKDTEALKNEIKSALQQVHDECAQQKAEVRQTLLNEYNEQVHAIRKDAEARVKAATIELEEEKKEMMASLEKDTPALAERITNQILGRKSA